MKLELFRKSREVVNTMVVAELTGIENYTKWLKIKVTDPCLNAN